MSEPSMPNGDAEPAGDSGGGGMEPVRPKRGWLRSVGPAIIVASVVLGPGSILTASRVGTEYGYDMIWVLVVCAVLMISLVALAGRLGVTLEGTLCDELAARLGRPVAVLIGGVVFLIVTAFQTGNNVAVLTALEPLLEVFGGAELGPMVSGGLLVVLNGFIIAVLFGLRRLYGPIEKAMMVLVGLMVIGFVANLAMARPSLAGVLSGLIPMLPAEASDGLIPFRGEDGAVVDPLWAITGMFATTVSVAGAFYQGYLVREKGWHLDNVHEGLTDSIVGIAILGLVAMMIMTTSAAVLHETVDADDLSSAADVAMQLEPLFGQSAMLLFGAGIFAGAFSSFLVNAMIGGTLMSDGLGKGGRMDQRGIRVFTTAALVVSMGIALVAGAEAPVQVIIFAQALTVLGLPVLAIALVYLATRPDLKRPVPMWMKAMGVLIALVTVLMGLRTAWRLVLDLGG